MPEFRLNDMFMPGSYINRPTEKFSDSTFQVSGSDRQASVRQPTVIPSPADSCPSAKHRCFEMLSQDFCLQNIYALKTKVICFAGSYFGSFFVYTFSQFHPFSRMDWKALPPKETET